MTEKHHTRRSGYYSGPFTTESGTDSEWLVTNGIGGFAASSIIDCPLRKYSGLLVTPLKNHEGRYHILSAIEAHPHGDPEFSMSTNYYPGAIHPQGYRNLDSFSVFPVPTWLYSKDGVKIKKEVLMIDGESSVYIGYTHVDGKARMEVELKFLFTFRDANYTTHENEDLTREVKEFKSGFSITPYPFLQGAALEFSGDWKRSGDWYWDNNIEYPIELQRGLDYSEDRFVPGNVSVTLEKDKPFVIRVSVIDDKYMTANEGQLLSCFNRTLKTFEVETREINTNRKYLDYMGRHFILKNSGGQRSINAGFPWFGEWGRDTMIALPGLTFDRGMTDLGIEILAGYASLIRDGLLPNTLGESQGFTSYNSIDAGLLYCWAVRKLIDRGYEIKSNFEKKIIPAVKSIVMAFIKGNVPNARLTPEGLLDTGSADTQLTWMDATAWGKPVTPRHGLAVDLNALWYDSLWLLKELLTRTGKKTPKDVMKLLEIIPPVFTSAFLVNNEPLYLSDTVVNGQQDRKIRPNMLFASSAAPGLLTREIRAGITRTAERELLTPMGMRTLAASDPDFAPVYSGNGNERDSKYHQGTVWPWPLGIMIESSLLTAIDLEKTINFWEKYLTNLLMKHLHRQGAGFLSEIFDGLEPVDGKGSFAQAWSTGEIMRAYSHIEWTKAANRSKK